METFEKEITFLSKQLVDGTEWALVETSKMATFKELSRVDKNQHKLHFMLISLFSSTQNEDEENKTVIDSDSLYDLTVKAIKMLLVVNNSFNDTDKAEFLNDSGAILNFGLWALKEKFTPFLSMLNQK
jgi:hypothetical protein